MGNWWDSLIILDTVQYKKKFLVMEVFREKQKIALSSKRFRLCDYLV